MDTITLQRDTWHFDQKNRIGDISSFAEVFKGTSNDGKDVAIKRLNISAKDTGNRELDISKELIGKSFENVIQIYDAGIDSASDRYFIVMALAEKSLAKQIQESVFDEPQTIETLDQIINGLLEVDELVHRDLKPANILLHMGKWKICDFGISKFIEESTQDPTQKGNFTFEYAAPEQWRMEHATHQTDIYALGCIAHALLTGSPPFPGPDYKKQHLHDTPQKLLTSDQLNQLVWMCLKKNEKSRPTRSFVKNQLLHLSESNSISSNLSKAAFTVAEKQLKLESENVKTSTELQFRNEMKIDAFNSLDSLVDILWKNIQNDAVNAKIHGEFETEWSRKISLGNGSLTITLHNDIIAKGEFKKWGKDIVCGAYINILQLPDVNGYEGRASNLCFGDLDSSNIYRWWEICFFQQGFTTMAILPHYLNWVTSKREIDLACSEIMHIFALASTPRPIDLDYTDEFFKKWIDLLALAANCNLRRPTSLPEK